MFSRSIPCIEPPDNFMENVIIILRWIMSVFLDNFLTLFLFLSKTILFLGLFLYLIYYYLYCDVLKSDIFIFLDHFSRTFSSMFKLLSRYLFF